MKELVQMFLANELTAPQFEQRYMDEWRRWRDTGLMRQQPPAVASAYGAIFTALDCYCSDPSLRNAYSIDERQLRSEVTELFAEILAAEGAGQT